MNIGATFTNGLKRLVTKLSGSEIASSGNSGFQIVDSEGGKLPAFSKDEALRLFSSWIYISANMNAQAIAATPLRLYYARARGQSLPKHAPFREISIRKQFMLQSKTTNSLVQSAEQLVEITEHPVLDLMREVNPFRNRTDFMAETIEYKQCTGDAYWFIKDGTGVMKGIPEELWTLPSQLVTIVPDDNKFIKGYIYGKGTKRIALRADQVIHFREPNLRDLYYGMGRIEACYEAATGYAAMDEFESKAARNPIPSLLVKYTNGTLSKKQRRELTLEWDRLLNVQGGARSNIAGVADQNVDISPLSFLPRDMQFIQGRKWRRSEIAQAFGQTMALFEETANRANVDGALYKWARFELDPSMTMLSEKFNEKLLPRYDQGLYMSFDTITPQDTQMVLQTASALQRAGAMSKNEMREMLGLQPLDDERANDPFYAAPEKNVPLSSTETPSGREVPPMKTHSPGMVKRLGGGAIHPDLQETEILLYP